MESSAIKAYEILKKHNFSAEEAETIIASKDESLSKWVASKEDLAAVKLELKEEIASVRTELKKEIASLREGVVRMEARLDGSMARLETDFTKAQSTMIKWFVGTSIALVGIVFAIVKLAG